MATTASPVILPQRHLGGGGGGSGAGLLKYFLEQAREDDKTKRLSAAILKVLDETGGEPTDPMSGGALPGAFDEGLTPSEAAPRPGVKPDISDTVRAAAIISKDVPELSPNELVQTQNFLGDVLKTRRAAREQRAFVSGARGLGVELPGAVDEPMSAEGQRALVGLGETRRKEKEEKVEGDRLLTLLPEDERASLKGSDISTVRTAYTQYRQDIRETRRQDSANKMLDARLSAAEDRHVRTLTAQNDLLDKRLAATEQFNKEAEAARDARDARRLDAAQTRLNQTIEGLDRRHGETIQGINERFQKGQDEINSRFDAAQQGMDERQRAQLSEMARRADQQIANQNAMLDKRLEAQSTLLDRRLEAQGEKSPKEFDQVVDATHSRLQQTVDPNIGRDKAVLVVKQMEPTREQLIRLYGGSVQNPIEKYSDRWLQFSLAGERAEQILATGKYSPEAAAARAAREANSIVSAGRIIPDQVWAIGSDQAVKQQLILTFGVTPENADSLIRDWKASGIWRQRTGAMYQPPVQEPE